MICCAIVAVMIYYDARRVSEHTKDQFLLISSGRQSCLKNVCDVTMEGNIMTLSPISFTGSGLHALRR